MVAAANNNYFIAYEFIAAAGWYGISPVYLSPVLMPVFDSNTIQSLL